SSNLLAGEHLLRTNWNALDERTVFTYDGSNRLTSVTRPSGWRTTNTYDSNSRLSTAIDLDTNGPVYFRTNSFTWANGLLASHTDPRGLTINYSYDALNRLTNASFPDSTTITFAYDKLDLIRVVDRLGFTNRWDYNTLRQ